jgi:aerobic-type carbon monoxide dehydrogenase small subunit (CoxS/CutS family)
LKKSEKREKKTIVLKLNGEVHELEIGDGPCRISPSDTLAHTLRENLGHTGTKIGCDQGACGSCTIIMNGKPILSCMTLTVECHNSSISTIEGLADPKTGKLHPIQQAFVDHSAFQCGFCTPGIIMASKSLLDNQPAADRHAVKEALSGHYCRCISHYQVLDAVMDAAGKGGKTDDGKI